MGLAGGSILVELCVGEFACSACAFVEVVEVPARFQVREFLDPCSNVGVVGSLGLGRLALSGVPLGVAPSACRVGAGGVPKALSRVCLWLAHGVCCVGASRALTQKYLR